MAYYYPVFISLVCLYVSYNVFSLPHMFHSITTSITPSLDTFHHRVVG